MIVVDASALLEFLLQAPERGSVIHGILTFVHTVQALDGMSSAYVSGRVPGRYERLVTKQARAARTSKSDLVARYVIEKSLETEFPGISFHDSLSGREAYLTGHRVAVWEAVVVNEETKSTDKAARHFGWPRVLVKRALAYANAFPEEIASVSATLLKRRRDFLTAVEPVEIPWRLIRTDWRRVRDEQDRVRMSRFLCGLSESLQVIAPVEELATRAGRETRWTS